MASRDAGAYAAGSADASVRQFAHLPEPEYSEASVRALIEGAIAEGWRRGDLAVLTIADPVSDAFAGSLVLFGGDGDSIEIGFWLHPDARGRGLATAAVSLALTYARRCGFNRVTARTATDNGGSMRVLERTGFARTGSRLDRAPSGEQLQLTHFVHVLPPLSAFPLSTPRLTLRLHEQRDADALQRIYSRADVARYLLEEPWTREDAARHISERMPKVGVDGGSGALALIVEHDRRVIGDVQLWLTDDTRRVAEIGWVLDPAYGGRGLAGEAVRALLDLAFAHYGLHRVAAQMDERNTASARLAECVGMRREAHLRQNWWSKGEWADTLIYARLACDKP